MVVRFFLDRVRLLLVELIPARVRGSPGCRGPLAAGGAAYEARVELGVHGAASSSPSAYVYGHILAGLRLLSPALAAVRASPWSLVLLGCGALPYP